MMRAIPLCGQQLIKSFEKCVLRVYDDEQPDTILKVGDIIEGTLTAGWGHTGGLIIGMLVTQQMADNWFANDCTNDAASPIYAKIGDVVDDLTSNQMGALGSFVFNVGTGNPNEPEWTIWKRLRARQFDQVPQEMTKFVNFRGQKCQGLVRRRAAEVLLWSTDEPGSVDINPPSSQTRTQPTPPTPADPVPIFRSPAVIAGSGGIAASSLPMINQILQVIKPELVGHDQVLAVLAVVGIACAVTALVMIFILKRNQRN